MDVLRKDEEMAERHIVLGILAHVDAGKTTLSESMLYLCGDIRNQGRVDHGDSHMDTDQMEQERGITIFAGQAEMTFGDFHITLLDTPGHVDFSPEMERTLSVLDEAVLVISAPDGVTGQVRTLWKLLRMFSIPTFIFVNKMDQPGMDEAKILAGLRAELSANCIRFDGASEGIPDEIQEDVAVCDDALLERFLDNHPVTQDDAAGLIRGRKVFPVYFGSALHNEGVSELLKGLSVYSTIPDWPDKFAARVFRITHDDKNNRLTWMKIVGGELYVKQVLPGYKNGNNINCINSNKSDSERKVDQIRIYSGKGFQTVQKVSSGQICAILGVSDTIAGEWIGDDEAEDGGTITPVLQPVFTRSIITDPSADRSEILKDLRILEEEEPMLHIGTDKATGEITAHIMGQVQTEILQNLFLRRFGQQISFGPASLVYKETVAAPTEGVGHYEPLRHYAEVHLLIEPASRGSGVTFNSRVSTDQLSLNWQRLIISSLEAAELKGVLTGSELTDVRITLIGGKASEKHTDGGDFRQASLRALRQGLMMAQNILMEPVYDLTAIIPSENSGRFLTDIRRMDGSADLLRDENSVAEFSGRVPAASFGDYQADVRAYTHGSGSVTVTPGGYIPCRNAEEIIEERAYDPEADLDFSPDSIFCSHGAGMLVPWDQVRNYMHVDTGFRFQQNIDNNSDYIENLSQFAAQSGTKETIYTDSNLSNDEDIHSISVKNLRQQSVSSKYAWKEEQERREQEEKNLQNIFEKTYGTGKWNTPLHNEQNISWSNKPGIWSKDGSLEREEQLKKEKAEKNALLSPDSGRKTPQTGRKTAQKEDYLLVDGYNIIFAWPELRELAACNIDSARDRLIDILEGYQGTRSGSLILVFDAYKVHGGRGEVYHNHNIDVVYTREAETADTYIVKTAHKLSNKGNVTVATSDGIIQIIILGDGAHRLSARDFEAQVKQSAQELREKYHLDH